MFKFKIFIFLALVLAAAGLFYFSGFFKSKFFSFERENILAVLNDSNLMAKDKILPADSLEDKNGNKSASSFADKSGNFTAPMDRVQERITKKKFGMFITPETSPVQPDKFRGFHTGVDFEVFLEELEKDIPVRAICSGTLKLKKTASGYGGVAVEECESSGELMTVIYGHLRLGSVEFASGDKIKAGETIGVLGKDKSSETDGARKHLHLAIHQGKNIELKGYIDSVDKLSEWIDPCLYGVCGF